MEHVQEITRQTNGNGLAGREHVQDVPVQTKGGNS